MTSTIEIEAGAPRVTEPKTRLEPKTNGGAKAKTEPKAAPKKKPAKKPSARKCAARPKAGLIYEREFKGKKYLLTSAADKGEKIIYKLRGGETYGSLTAAAKAVTEYASISGVAFWGEGLKASSGAE